MKKIKWFLKVLKEFIIPDRYLANIQPTYDKIMSFNIRRDTLKDGIYNWQYRKRPIIEMLSCTEPSIICLQECMPHMWKFLKRNTRFSYNGYFTDVITKSVSLIPFSEGLGILYSKSYDCLKKGYIKLSNEFGFDTKYWRICQYVKLHCKKTDRTFWILNTHLDHLDRNARIKGCEIIHSFIQQNCKEESVIICGDFNDDAFNENSTLKLLADNYTFVHYSKGTYHGFGRTKRHIDFIFTNEHIYDMSIVDSDYGIKYLSDHYPIIVEL